MHTYTRVDGIKVLNSLVDNLIEPMGGFGSGSTNEGALLTSYTPPSCMVTKFVGHMSMGWVTLSRLFCASVIPHGRRREIFHFCLAK